MVLPLLRGRTMRVVPRPITSLHFNCPTLSCGWRIVISTIFLRIPTQCNNVTLGRKRLNRFFGRHSSAIGKQ